MKLTKTLASVLVFLAVPQFVLADDITVSGEVVSDGNNGVLLKTADATYAVESSDEGMSLAALRELLVPGPDGKPRKATVEGETMGKLINDPTDDSKNFTRLDVYNIVSPKSVALTGVVRKAEGYGSGMVLKVEEGSSELKGKALSLSGAPGVTPLFAKLQDRRMLLRGWTDGSELLVKSAQATVKEPRNKRPTYISQKRFDKKAGEWKYQQVGPNLNGGMDVRIVDLAVLDRSVQGEARWKPITEYDPSVKYKNAEGKTKRAHLVFAYVEVGRPRYGEEPLKGWMPVFKLNLGEEAGPEEPEQQEMVEPEQKTIDGDAKGGVGNLDDLEQKQQKTD